MPADPFYDDLSLRRIHNGNNLLVRQARASMAGRNLPWAVLHALYCPGAGRALDVDVQHGQEGTDHLHAVLFSHFHHCAVARRDDKPVVLRGAALGVAEEVSAEQSQSDKNASGIECRRRTTEHKK